MSGFVTSWEPINERIAIAKLDWRGRILNLIVVYAPNEDASLSMKDNFEETLKDVLEIIPQNQEIIMGGDFNSRVGK